MRRIVFIGMLALIGGGASGAQSADSLRYLNPNGERGASDAVVVGDVPLVHTTQLLPLDANGQLVGGDDAAGQTEQVLKHLERVLASVGSRFDRLVKLNIYAADAASVTRAEGVLAQRFATDRKPAVSYVATRLPHPGVLVAIDAVAAADESTLRAVTLHRAEGCHPATGAHLSVMPFGTRIYVAGQAEKGATLAEATRKTLESLRNTVRYLGRRDADVVQLKAFLSPMSDVSEVQAAVTEFYGPERTPPLVCMEWSAPLIEIELIAWGGSHQPGPVVEYLTPPGMSTPTIYSRIARINSTRSIYTSGLFARDTSDAAAETKDLFGQLERSLRATGSDLRHLVKATYYCATQATSQKLNELRPMYYDPQRPPSASKAMVTGVGRAACGMTIDMIAVPAWDDAQAEYGPAEFGHGLTAEQARAGWCSLFDGQSTFGWRDAQVDRQELSAGTTTTDFGDGTKVLVDVSRPGVLYHGKATHQLAAGNQTLELSRPPAPLRLDAAVRVRSLCFQPAGLQPIFNGTDMAGWRRIDRDSIPDSARTRWSVADGALRAEGGPGALEYTSRQYGNFVLQLDVRTGVRHANGGVFFRAIAGDFMNGYEAQVYHRAHDGDPARPVRYSTGALDDHQMARRLVSRDGDASTMTIVARGPHLATWVNGVQMTDWVDTREMAENPREGLRVAPGVIQLQAHDAGTVVEFSNLRLAEIE